MELQLIPEAYRLAKASLAQDIEYRRAFGDKLPRIYALAGAAGFVGAVATCAVFGHRWVDSGYGGPDSGCIDINCARCGFEHGRTTLY